MEAILKMYAGKTKKLLELLEVANKDVDAPNDECKFVVRTNITHLLSNKYPTKQLQGNWVIMTPMHFPTGLQS